MKKSKYKILVSADNKSYKLVRGVPVILPKNTPPKWYREIVEAILWEHPEEIIAIYNELSSAMDYSEIYIKHIEKVLKNKSGIIRTLESYAETGTKREAPITESKITHQQKREFGKFAKKSIGKKRTATKINAVGSFSVYPHFAKAVTDNKPRLILELGTGAGGGTAAIGLNMDGTDTLFTVDMDFPCLGNAVGIRKYQKKAILPLCASFHALPFFNSSVDTVCTYNGLDESREITLTIAEVSRILKNCGRFVVVSRENAFMRQNKILSHFGFEKEETLALMKKCRLYSDIDALDAICKSQRLHRISREVFVMNDNLTYVLSVYEKA